MALASTARYSSALTAAAYKLVAAAEVELLDTGYYAINGECGHRLTVVAKHEVPSWSARIEAKKRHRRRCEACVKDPAAHQARLNF